MIRVSLTAVGVLFLCSTASTQTPVGYNVLNGKLRDGGTFHWVTKTWTRAKQAQAPTQSLVGQTVYDNTCMWTGFNVNQIQYNTMEPCEEIYVAGRIPTTNANSTPSNLIDSFRIGYVTHMPTGQVDVEYSFYDYIGANCSGPYGPPRLVGADGGLGDFRLDSGNGITLPGDPLATGKAWLVTIDLTGGAEFCLWSDGDGTAGNGNDQFSMRFRTHEANTAPNPPGCVAGGDPLMAGFGACTYTTPCGNDPHPGVGPCGTGLSTADGFWENLDGAGCPGGPSSGNGCYFWGGWPLNPWSNYFLRLTSAGDCSGGGYQPTFYCTGKTTSEGCQPYMDWMGTASATSTGPFKCIGRDVLGSTIGILLYSNKKGAEPDHHGGKLCIKSPFKRTPGKNAKTPSNGICVTATGRYVFDFQNRIQGGTDASLTAGANVFVQFRGRDVSDPAGFGDSLTDGMKFAILP